MANVYVNETSLQDIADSIRVKNGTQNTYKPGEMAAAIDALPSGGVTPTGELEITTNGTYDVTNYASAEVDVPQSGITPTGTISITQNGTTDVTNYASAFVNVPSSSGALYPLNNGTFTFSNGTKVTVTNGNHVKVEMAVATNSFVDFSDITENTSDATTSANVQNHQSKFNISANQKAIFMIYNATLPSKANFNVYGTGTSNLGMAIADLSAIYGDAIKTFTVNSDVGCVFFVSSKSGTFEFDVAFYVDGVKYI